MFFSRKKAASSAPLLDGVKPSNNGGRSGRLERERKPKSHAGGAAPTARSESAGPAQRASAREQEHGGSRATRAPEARPAAVADGWASKHGAALGERTQRARLAAMESGKPWTLHADEQTRAIMADCPERRVSAATAAKYRRAYDNLRATGQTALEAASTRAHWDFLRTATRFCMEADVRAWRAASERARKRGDLDSAQRRTERAFRLASVMDEEFMRRQRRTWTHKAAEMKAAGQRPLSKSKRSTCAPVADVAAVLLLSKQKRVQARHAERLIVLALTGARPEELKAGVRLTTATTPKGRPMLRITLTGAKFDETRGHEARQLSFPASSGVEAKLAAKVAAHGGRWTLETTDADHRSLNRVLKTAGVSCYSFRHQQGSELKAAVASGAITDIEAAAAMGHRSTASLAYYGSRNRAHGGRKMRAVATEQAEIRTVPVTFAAKAAARAARAARAGIGAAPPAAAPATPAPRAAPRSQRRPKA